MRIEHNVRADFQRPGVRPVIRVAEGDAGTRFVVMDLYNGGQPYSVGTGVTGVVKYAKTDGHSGVYDTLDEGEATERAAVVFHDSSRQAVVELATNICKGFGLVAVIVQFIKDDEILTTFPLDVIVERDPTDGTRAEDYFSFKALDALYSRLAEMGDDLARISPEQTDFFAYTNKFDKTSSAILNGYMASSYTEAAGYHTTHPIYVHRGLTYKARADVDNLGSNARVVFYVSGDTFEQRVLATLDDGYVVFTAPKSGYVRFNIGRMPLGSYMVSTLDKYPPEYIDYGAELSTYVRVKVQRSTIEGMRFVEPENLYNYMDNEGHGYFRTANGTIAENANNYASYVRVYRAGTYRFNVNSSLFGSSGSLKIPAFTADKVYIKSLQATSESTELSTARPAELVITADDIANGVTYLGYTAESSRRLRNMIIVDAAYPDGYIPYVAPYWTMDDFHVDGLSSAENKLFMASIAFDGDSICNGGSAQDGKSGWAGRIGDRNTMAWKNYGVGGGTIGEYDGSDRHSVLETLDTIYADTPNLDYLILEGGTNDADIIGVERLGTFDQDDYAGPFDTTTFSGSMDALLKSALEKYPSARIGYIVAQKMGYSSSSYGPDNTRRKFFRRAMEICVKWGIPYIDLWDAGQLNPKVTSMYNPSLSAAENIAGGYLYTDGQHLTGKGYDLITPKIEAWIRTL